MASMNLLQFAFLAPWLRLQGCGGETILTHNNEMSFGSWRYWDNCSSGSFANAFEVKAAEEERNFRDDVGMTGIRLFCMDKDTRETTTEITSFASRQGGWKGKRSCPDGEWLTGFKIRMEHYQGWVRDDTAANNVEMTCTSGINMDGGGTSSGGWLSLSSCPEDESICGVRVRFENVLVTDKMGLVAMHMKCCRFERESSVDTRVAVDDPARSTSSPPGETLTDAPQTFQTDPSEGDATQGSTPVSSEIVGIRKEVLRNRPELNFGKTHVWDNCSSGSFASGFQVKADSEDTNAEDLEGMTGVRLVCTNLENIETGEIESHSSQKGEWGERKSCPNDEWFTGFRIKIENYRLFSQDDTAANDLEMICGSGSEHNGGGTSRGIWGSRIECSPGDAICGVQTIVGDIPYTDKTGVVSVRFKCCPQTVTIP